MFAEHPGQDRLGWAGAQGKKSSNLILMELGQRFVLQVKHQAQSTLQIRKTSQDRCSGINIPPNLCCYGARWSLEVPLPDWHLRQVLCPVPAPMSIPGTWFMGSFGPLVPVTCSSPAICAKRGARDTQGLLPSY